MKGSKSGQGRDMSSGKLAEALAQAARFITAEDCFRAAHMEALALLKKAGFEENAVAGGCCHVTQKEKGELSTVFLEIRWSGAGAEKREVYPELVTGFQLYLNEAVGTALSGYPEDHGASTIQLELVRGLVGPFLDAEIYQGIGSNPAYFRKHGYAGWLRKFRSDGALVIRIPIRDKNYKQNERVEAQLRFWDGFPGSAHAKPI